MNNLIQLIRTASTDGEAEKIYLEIQQKIIQQTLTGKIRKDYAGKLSPIIPGQTWWDALRLPQQLNFDRYLGCVDWYLPDLIELVSMYDWASGKPVPGCEDMVGLKFWSSTQYANDVACAWRMNFGNGRFTDHNVNYDSFAARCVRP